MGENQLLVDTDILIAYLNHKAYRAYLENPKNKICYSAITKKSYFRNKVSEPRKEYSRLRLTHPSLQRGDALIAASALVRNLPLLTQNLRHFRVVKGLVLLPINVSQLG